MDATTTNIPLPRAGESSAATIADTRPPREPCPVCCGALKEQRLQSSCSRCGLLYATCCDIDPPPEV